MRDTKAMKKEWIHTPRDGRGARRVLLNGKEIHDVVLVNLRKGVAVFDMRDADGMICVDYYKGRLRIPRKAIFSEDIHIEYITD